MRRLVLLFVLLLAGGFITGCRSVSGKPSPAAPEDASAALEKSEELSEATLKKRARAHAHYGAGVIHELDEQTDLALEDYFQAAAEDPDDEALVLEVSRRFLQKRQAEKALELVTRAAARPNASGLIYARLGLIQAQLGKQEEAIAANQTAISKAPDDLPGYQNLFLVHLQSHRMKEAVAVLDEAAARPNPTPEFLLALAELYSGAAAQAPTEKEPLQAKALALLERVEKQKPRPAHQQLLLAEQLNALGAPERAARIYQELLKQFPNMPMLRERIHARLSEIYLKGNDHQRAAEQLEALTREDPTNPQLYLFLGSLALEDKQAEKAVDNFSRALLLKPDLEQAYYDLANAQLMLDKPGDTLATLDKARQRFARNFVLEFLSALAFSREKDFKQALAHFSEAEVLAQAGEPKRLNEFFYFQFASAYERNGDYAQAERLLRKALQLAPEFVEAMNYLGYMWADMGTNLDEARTLIDKALKAEPESAAYLDSLGWVFFKQGRPKEALEQLQKAVKFSKEPDATIYDHLGDVYVALKQREQALEAWQKSLSLESNEKVKKKLEQLQAEHRD
jgi:tetratricopeptide (TPR) repeat protein